MRYLSQRFAMPNRIAMGTLNDIGTEEWVHIGYQWFRTDEKRLTIPLAQYSEEEYNKIIEV